MKGLSEEPRYAIELLEEGATIGDVIDGYISEHALVSLALRIGGKNLLLLKLLCNCRNSGHLRERGGKLSSGWSSWTLADVAGRDARQSCHAIILLQRLMGLPVCTAGAP